VFTHRRPDQLRRTLMCLRETGIDQLYVFSDGPRGAAEAGAVERVRELVASLRWIDPVIVARNENLGVSRSIRAGLDWLFASHDSVIVVEDDVSVAPEFYDFVRRALVHYEGEPSVAGITGQRYPFNRRAFDGYAYDVFLSPRFCSWGWATWGDRWRGFCFDKAALRREIELDGAFRPQRAGADMPGMVQEAVVTETLTGSWDVVCATNMLLRGQYFVTPAWNMVENTGLSDGTHFSEPPPWELRWEAELCPPLDAIRFAPPQVNDQVLREYLRFFKPSRVQLARARLHALAARLARS
jgi:hypothetical protein